MSRRFPTLDHVWLFAGVAFIALRPLLTPIPPNDFWWHMATGRIIVQTGVIPTTDIFSFTQSGTTFYNQSWLAQVLMYAFHSLGGAPLLIVVQALVLALAYGLLLQLCIRRSGSIRLSVGLLLLAIMPLSFDNWLVRPQSYAFPLFVAFLVILTDWRKGGSLREKGGDATLQTPKTPGVKHTLWLLPLLMMIWVNLHGSFVLGGALITLTFIGEAVRRFIENRRAEAAWAHRPVGKPEDSMQRPEPTYRPPLRQLLVWGGLTAAALLINPRGFEVLLYVRDLLNSSAVTTLVTEWAPPTTRDISGVIFVLFLMFAFATLAYARHRPDPIDMLIAGALLWLAFGAVRNIVWFGMAATPLLVVQTASRVESRSGERPRFSGAPKLNATLIGFITLLILLALPWVKPILDLPPELGSLLAPGTPIAAVEHMQNDPRRPQHLFNEMGYGSYLIWAAPDQPVFVDTRIEVYPYEQWQEYILLNNGIDVPELFDKYQIDGLLLDNAVQADLLEVVRADPDWEVRYEDDYTTYLIRSDE